MRQGKFFCFFQQPFLIDIPVSSNIIIKIYDQLGKEIYTLVNDFKDKGSYQIELNAKALSSGIYYYKLESVNFFQIRKLVVLK